MRAFAEVPVSTSRRRYGLTLGLGLLGFGLGDPVNASSARAVLATSDKAAKYQLLHNFGFRPREDGGYPAAGVIQGADGRLYGTTVVRGAYDLGTVYAFSQEEGITVLYAFQNTNESGAIAPLLQGPDGALYGTAKGYYAENLLGTVYRVDLDGRYTQLHGFTGLGEDGARPSAALIQASDGHYYGTTMEGGAAGMGTVFRMTSQGQVQTLWSLDGRREGALPTCQLLQASDGHLYGTTSHAGYGQAGTIFRLTLDGQFTLLHTFRQHSGWRPTAGLIQATDGDLYGVTPDGGYQPSTGSLFKITLGGEFTVLQRLRSKRGPIGCHSTAGLIQARDGGIYGTTTMGSRNDSGSAFRMMGDELEALHRYQDIPGYQTRSALFEASDGCLYGTSQLDGLYGHGTLYRLSAR